MGELGVAELGDAVERRPLSDGAWVDLRPGFITAADELFDVLAGAVPWREEQMRIYDSTVRVPRLLAHYAPGDALPHPVLDEARSALSAHYAEELGGQIIQPVQQVPGVSFGVLADAQGHRVGVAAN